MGYERSGTGLEVIMGLAKKEINGLTKEDMGRHE